MQTRPIDITIVGGGMITNDLLLPSIYQLRRMGMVQGINVCALNSAPLKALQDNAEIRQAFPEQEFTPYPAISQEPEKQFPLLYREVIAGMNPFNAVVVAMPDHLHYEVVKESLLRNQHVLCVKPLVLKYAQTVELEKLAFDRGLFVGVEYHKRFDRRALMARREYELGRFGEFRIGEAKMIEPYYYRFSNFQNWFTIDKTDPFVYVGCHYVDLVYFITGLKPVEVSVSGIKGRFPNGSEGFMWANGRVRYENGALLSVTDGLGYPDEAAGNNEQCLSMFFEGRGRSGHLKHNDQFRGVEYAFLEGPKRFAYVSPDFYRLVPWNGPGYKPVGYGFDSVAATVETIHRLENGVAGLPQAQALSWKRQVMRETDKRGIIATPANSYINELVVEAARMSILSDGQRVKIIYGDNPRVEPV